MDVDTVILPREAMDIVQNHINTIGVFEGIPYRIQTEGGQNLNYYVDLTDGAIFRDFEFEVKLKKRLGLDSFFDNANGTSFELMAANGVQFNLIDIPYVIVKDNQVELGLTIGLSLYVMTHELIDQIIAISKGITNIIQAVSINATIPPSLTTGQIITLAIKILLQIAVAALLLVAIVKMAQQFFELIFPKIRYFQGCKVKELLKKGSEYLGYDFQSTLLDGISGATICPVPLLKQKQSIWDQLENDLNFAFTKGYPTASDSTPTLGSLFDAMETQFNGRTKVRNGLVEFEVRNYWQDLTSAQILPALNLQNDRVGAYSFNVEDIWKRYFIHYQTDQSDVHTLDFFDPTDAEYSTEPNNVVNADLVTIKGLNDVNIPFALGVRKNSLNFMEKRAKSLFEVVDEIVNAFGGNGNFASQITNRIGVMQISQQFFVQSKFLFTIGGKQPANYADLLRASTIYNNYHKINEITINDYKIISDAPVRLNSQDFVNLLDNNYAEINGVVCEILTIQYIDEESKAVISYKEPFNYANGKVSIITINS
tara:strand:+ start:22928 stop:24547 length:1620 start_codon:yes stop_codon:yes gene_type:complete